MTAQKLLKSTAFYALVVVIVVFSVFPFYYAIVTSFATGTELFAINYLPRRGADGRAVLRSSVREYLAGEALHALGVPTILPCSSRRTTTLVRKSSASAPVGGTQCGLT